MLPDCAAGARMYSKALLLSNCSGAFPGRIDALILHHARPYFGIRCRPLSCIPSAKKSQASNFAQSREICAHFKGVVATFVGSTPAAQPASPVSNASHCEPRSKWLRSAPFRRSIDEHRESIGGTQIKGSRHCRRAAMTINIAFSNVLSH